MYPVIFLDHRHLYNINHYDRVLHGSKHVLFKWTGELKRKETISRFCKQLEQKKVSSVKRSKIFTRFLSDSYKSLLFHPKTTFRKIRGSLQEQICCREICTIWINFCLILAEKFTLNNSHSHSTL